MKKINIALLFILAAGNIGVVYAAAQSNDALSITTAKISLRQAVSTAEKHVGGKADKAEFEHENGKWAFNIEIVKNSQVVDVVVDAMNGKVLSSAIDKNDQEDTQDLAD